MSQIDSTTTFLFTPFPRECASPQRVPMKEFSQFVKFIDIHNGVADCYTDLYTYPFNGIIDKIYFDIDGVENGMEEALPFAQLFYRFLTQQKGLNVIPVASGKKGFNLYVILKPQSYSNAKQLLQDVSWSLVCECFGKVASITYHDDADVRHPTTAVVDENGKILMLIYIDPKVIGDVRRFSRVPNTLRPTILNYCTYLPADEFLNMTIQDVYHHIKTRHEYNFNLTSKVSLSDIKVIPNLKELHTSCSEDCNCASDCGYTINVNSTSEESKILEMALPQCLYRGLLSPEPRHDNRVAATAFLLNSDFTVDQILKMYQALGWMDFDSKITEDQIRSCRYLKTYSQDKLRSLGICYKSKSQPKCEICGVM